MQTDNRILKQGQQGMQVQQGMQALQSRQGQVNSLNNFQTPNYSQFQQQPSTFVNQNYSVQQGNLKQNQNYFPPSGQQVKGPAYQQNYPTQINKQPSSVPDPNGYNNPNESQRMNMSQSQQNNTQQNTKEQIQNMDSSDDFGSRYRYFGPPQKKGKASNPGNGNIAPQSVETKFSA